MRLLRRPDLWAVGLALLFTITLAGGPTYQGDPLAADEPVAGGNGIEVTANPQMPNGIFSSDSSTDHGEDALFASADARNADEGSEGLETHSLGGAEMLVGQALVEEVGVKHGVQVASADSIAEEELDGIGGPYEEEEGPRGRADRPEIIVHTVRSGETLSHIASRYGVTTQTILAANDLINPNRLYVGQRLNILSIPGAIHTVQRGESLWDISRIYRTDMDEIVRVNDLQNPSRIRPNQELVIPGERAADIASSLRTERLISPDGRLLRAFSWPLRGRISSGYGPRWGRMHHGLDVAVVVGTPVRAAAAGVVTFSGWNGGYGNLVTIDHGNKIETRYAHLSRMVVRPGQHVKRGEIIAYSGNTGNSTGPHLHFEIRLRGNSVNPAHYLQ